MNTHEKKQHDLAISDLINERGINNPTDKLYMKWYDHYESTTSLKSRRHLRNIISNKKRMRCIMKQNAFSLAQLASDKVELNR